VYDYIDDLSPRVVIGLMPPYYPNVSNVTRAEKYDETINSMYTWLCDFVAETYGQAYSKEDFYTGISDLSYSSMDDSEAIRDSLNAFMPFFGSIYTLPLESIEEISMPCVNIGPWGKDFHKLTERVNKEDLYERTPTILNYAIRHILQGQV
jgi:arginine utilization protein RocB